MALTQAQITQAIQDAATNYGVPPGLLLKMLQQESGLNPTVHPSSAGAMGIAQFMPSTAKQYGVDPTDTSDSSVLAQIGAAAHLMSDNAKQLNNGKLPSISDQTPWLKAAAAYNAGVGAVAEAEKKGFINKDFDGSGGWVQYLPKETQDYVHIMQGKGGSSGSATDWANNYATSKGLVKPSTSTSGVATPSTPGTLQPPNISDFQTDDGNGGKVTDTAGYYKAWNDYVQAQQAQQKLQSGPLAQYVNDTISDITQQIEAGKLDVSKANNLLTAKISAFKDANDVYSSDAFRYGAPVGATTAPSTNIPISGGVTMNPLQQALDISNQAQGLFSGMQTPGIPSVSQIMANYGGQYGGKIGANVQAEVDAHNMATSNPLQMAVTQQQNGAAPNAPITYTGFDGSGNTPPPPPPAPPPAPMVAGSQVYNADQQALIRQMMAGGMGVTQ